MKNTSVSIMQPYIFPYIGYFHLIESCDKFVFFDDVNYIKKGWINRNRILLNNSDHMFTVPVSKVSQNKLINEIRPIIDVKWKKKFFLIIENAYKKAPFYDAVLPIIKDTINKKEYNDITDLCIQSIKAVYLYIGKTFEYTKSSSYQQTGNYQNKADRLLEITKMNNGTSYHNSIGGLELYKKEYFKKNNINLTFVKSDKIEYKQFNNEFIENLSIIDVLMFNDINQVKKIFNNYKLI